MTNYNQLLTTSGWQYQGKTCACAGGLEKFKKGTELIKVNTRTQTFIKVSGSMQFSKPLNEIQNYI